MRKFYLLGMVCLLTVFSVTTVLAADYQCVGSRIEKSRSAWGCAELNGSNYKISKGSSTIAFVSKRGSKWVIQDAGSNSLAWLDGDKINKYNNSSWGNLREAKALCDGPDPVAAAIWVLKQLGKI